MKYFESSSWIGSATSDKLLCKRKHSSLERRKRRVESQNNSCVFFALGICQCFFVIGFSTGMQAQLGQRRATALCSKVYIFHLFRDQRNSCPALNAHCAVLSRSRFCLQCPTARPSRTGTGYSMSVVALL